MNRKNGMNKEWNQSYKHLALLPIGKIYTIEKAYLRSILVEVEVLY